MEFEILEYDTAIDVCDKLINKIKSSSPKLMLKNDYRLEEFYSYQILDNMRINKLISEVEMPSRANTRPPVADNTVTHNRFEINHSIFPLFAGGYLADGYRRSRHCLQPDGSFNITELFEVRLSSMIPEIVYLLSKAHFDKEKFKNKYNKYEYEDMMELLECLSSQTMTNDEERKLLEYLRRDKVIDAFIFSKCIIPESSTFCYHHPVIFEGYFKNSVFMVERSLDILLAYCKSYMLPILLLYIQGIYKMSNNKPLLKIYIKSIQGYRIVVEKDLGAEFDFTVKFNDGVEIFPRIINISDYKEILNSKKDFDLDGYVNLLEEKMGPEVRNNFIGDINYRFKPRLKALGLNEEAEKLSFE